MIHRPYEIDLSWTVEPSLRPYRFRGVRRAVFEVAQSMLYTVTVNGEQEEIAVKPGFLTDGASIPLGLRWLIPQNQATWAPALFHDLAYGAQGWQRFTRGQCDALFGVGLTKQAIPARRIMAMYGSVAWFGLKSWRNTSVIDEVNLSGGHFDHSPIS